MLRLLSFSLDRKEVHCPLLPDGFRTNPRWHSGAGWIPAGRKGGIGRFREGSGHDGREEKRGPQEVVWDGRNDEGKALPSGVYFCRLQGESFSASRKILLAQ